MKAFIIVLSFTFAMVFSTMVKAEKDIPHEIGGFTLGSDIRDYPDAMNTDFLKEMVVTDWHGFRRGVISYGTCKYADRILRIQLKYDDSTKEYFKTLLNEFKKKYGAPSEWKGDSFGILHIWKWYFVDKDNGTISLILQHNLRDPNETLGNMVKLSYSDLMEEERDCFNQMCEEKKSEQDKQRIEELKKPDWQYLIPR